MCWMSALGFDSMRKQWDAASTSITMRWLHLIPRQPPPVCGVADYARCLSGAFQTRGMGSALVPFKSEADWREVMLAASRESTDNMIWVLHYSGYGYAKRGAPLGLLRSMREMRRERPQTRLVTMFHELFAGGAPWTSAFWFSMLQRHAAAGLARLSDAAVTNRRDSAVWLRKHLTKNADVSALPVFSNFGEDAAPKLPMARPARLMAFGGGPARRPDFWLQVEAAMNQLSLSELVMVSHPITVPESIRARFVVRQTGVLEPAAMAEELRSSRCGILDYNPDYLGKSGVLAAYAAHGVVPVLTQGHGVISEGLTEGRHFLSTADLKSTHDLEGVQNRLREWYAPHSLEMTAREYVRVATA